jgi:excisionase family DNA binding protein
LPSRLRGLDQAARLLGVSQLRVLELVEDGTLRAWRGRGGGVYLREDDLERFLTLEPIPPGTVASELDSLPRSVVRELSVEAWAAGDIWRSMRRAVPAMAVTLFVVPLVILAVYPAGWVRPDSAMRIIGPLLVVGVLASILVGCIVVLALTVNRGEWRSLRRALGASTIGVLTAAAVGTVVSYFAFFYWMLGLFRPESFNEPLTKVDAAYFSVTVFSTTGIGDITPKSGAARALVGFQMATGFLIVSFVVATVMARSADDDA